MVNLESPYLVMVLTLTLLGDITFDADQQQQTLKYEEMRVDSSRQVNTFSRVLFFTAGNLVARRLLGGLPHYSEVGVPLEGI